MIKQLSAEEQESLHRRYRNNDIFRHWSPLLCRMEWEMQELDLVTLWSEVENSLNELRTEKEHREEMIQYIFGRLMKDFRTVQDEFGEKHIRTVEQAECSAVTVMCIVLTMLMNAVENGHEEEAFANQPMCVAITAWLRSHPHFQYLMKDFFSRKMGFDGKKVVFTPSDPMNIQSQLDNMAEELRKEVEGMTQKSIDHTGSLEKYFVEHWDTWKELWRELCMDHEMLQLMQTVNPNKNEWGINQKMICNVIGLFIHKAKIEVSTVDVNRQLSDKQLSSYLRNHKAYGTSDCALNKQQHKKIEDTIDRLLSGHG